MRVYRRKGEKVANVTERRKQHVTKQSHERKGTSWQRRDRA